MATVSVPHREARSFKAHFPDGLKWVFSSPLIVAIVGAALAATVVPLLTREWQENEKQLNIKTTLATDMSKSFTNAIGAGRRIGTGLVYFPTTDRAENKAAIQAEYSRGLGQWQVDRGRLAAQLFARYRGDLIIDDGKPIVSRWRSYAQAVEQFYRLGAAIPDQDRNALVTELQGYFKELESQPWADDLLGESDWHSELAKLRKRPDTKLRRANLKTFYAKRSEFRKSYSRVADSLLLVGERFVERLLDLEPQV